MVAAVSWRTTPLKVWVPCAIVTICLLAGASGTILYCLAGEEPRWHEILFAIGVAIALLADRRHTLVSLG
jgi:hypothetical protein